MPVLIFAASALVSGATLLHNGIELAPAFPLRRDPQGISSLALGPRVAPSRGAPSPIFVRDL